MVDRLCNQVKKEDITVVYFYYNFLLNSPEMRLDREDKPEGMSHDL